MLVLVRDHAEGYSGVLQAVEQLGRAFEGLGSGHELVDVEADVTVVHLVGLMGGHACQFRGEHLHGRPDSRDDFVDADVVSELLQRGSHRGADCWK